VALPVTVKKKMNNNNNKKKKKKKKYIRALRIEEICMNLLQY